MFFLILGNVMFAIAFVCVIAHQRAIAIGFVSIGILFFAIGGMVLSGTFRA